MTPNVKLRLKERYLDLQVGDPVFHVYDKAFQPMSANPRSRARYALPRSRPPKSMYYGAREIETALWEVVLRNIIPVNGSALVPLFTLEPWMVVELEVIKPIRTADLRHAGLRHISQDSETRELLRELCACKHERYGETHSAARQVLARHKQAHGLSWSSAQTGAGLVHVFYEPPTDLATHLKAQAPYSLTSAKGLAAIDAALAQQGIDRI